MKTEYVKIFINLVLAVMSIGAYGQSAVSDTDVIKIHPMEITFNKTSSIIFPTIIKSVDRGSQDVLVQKAKGVSNVLQVKAARLRFPETNLTVITEDGYLHHFTITYAEHPKSLTTDITNVPTSGNEKPSPLIFQTDMTESEMETHAARIGKTKKTIRRHNEKKYKVNLELHGIYIKDNVIFYQIQLKNLSNINYDIDFLRFYIRDKRKMKRTASQEVEVKPLFTSGNNKVIKGKSTTDLVFALEKFTIPEAKHLVIELFELNGGRNLSLFIKNKTIVSARVIP